MMTTTMNNSRLFSIFPITISLVLLFAVSNNNYIAEAYCPVVICPGFGNDSIDYDTPLQQPSDVGLKSVLSRRGFDSSQIYTVPVKRSDWFRVAGGLFDVPDFYAGTAKPTGFGYGWYVQRLKETVDRAYEESGGEKVLLIGHSAGGWLARAAMADGSWSSSLVQYDNKNKYNNNNSSKDESVVTTEEEKEVSSSSSSVVVVVRTSDRIRCLATIGSIHNVPEKESTCVTRGALKYTDENYPGAFLRNDGIGYVSVGGTAIIGDESKNDNKNNNNDNDNGEEVQLQLLGSEVNDLYKKRGEGNANRVAYTSYKAVSGNGNLIGDGVVPFPWTQLDGSKQIELKNVLHSINEAGTTTPTDRWYGSEKVIDGWLPAVLEESNLKKNKNMNKKNKKIDLVDELQQWASNLVRR